MSQVPWQPVLAEEVPEAWKNAEAEARAMPDFKMASLRRRLGAEPGVHLSPRVALELPDYPVAREWANWMTTLPAAQQIPFVITSQEQWTSRRPELQATLGSLIRQGRPAGVWVLIWTRT